MFRKDETPGTPVEGFGNHLPSTSNSTAPTSTTLDHVDTLERALRLTSQGYYVHPVRPDKRPFGPWKQMSSNDPDQVRELWKMHPDALPAVSPGLSGLTVVDLDAHPGKPSGFEAAKAKAWPINAAVEGVSMSGVGRHLWYRGRADGDRDPASGINLRTKGYVVVTYDLPPADLVTEPLPTPYRGMLGGGVSTDNAPSAASNDSYASHEEVTAWMKENSGTPDRHLLDYANSWPTNPPFRGNTQLLARLKFLTLAGQEGRSGAGDAIEVLRKNWAAAGHGEGASGAQHTFHRALAKAVAATLMHPWPVSIESVTSDEQLPAQEEAFFESREWLGRLRDFARARRVSPWAMLGCVLARASAVVPPTVVLPATIGSEGSLNLFLALCGVSGSGKTAVWAAARDFLVIEGGVESLETAPGSGEGLLAAYVHTKTERGKPPRIVQHRTSVTFIADEVGSMGALMGRTNSTLTDFLKTGWSGAMLATQNADPEKQRHVPAHEYRLVLVAGVQPAKADIILEDAEGGFPQRWIWMPTFDPGRLGPKERPIAPESFVWRVPTETVHVAPDGSLIMPGRTVMQLPEAAVDAILTAAEERNRPISAALTLGSDALNGHAILSRTKVAAILALIDGRTAEVTEDDWLLAGIVLDVSDRTRGEIIGVRAATATNAADQKAKREGRSAAIVSDVQAETKIVRVMENLQRYLGDGEEWPKSRLRRKVRHSDRDVFDDALDRLVESGQVVTESREAQGGSAKYLRSAGGTR